MRTSLYKQTILMVVLVNLFNLATFSQEASVARINDKDGFTNVRSGRGTEFPVVAKLDKNDLFYCDSLNYEWIKIVALKYQGGFQVEGYIHKSRVQFLEYLDNTEKKEIIEKTLTTYGNLVKKWHKLSDQKKYDESNKALWEASNYSNRYDVILEIIPLYICQTKDTVTLQLFFATMWTDSGSANESPAFAIGDCYMREPDFILGQVRLIKNKEQRELLYDDIAHGLEFYSDSVDKGEIKKFKELEKKLNHARGKR